VPVRSVAVRRLIPILLLATPENDPDVTAIHDDLLKQVCTSRLPTASSVLQAPHIRLHEAHAYREANNVHTITAHYKHRSDGVVSLQDVCATNVRV
jgi:hypothetical protein